MKRGLLSIAIFLVVIGVAGSLVMVTGIIPIKASSGHLPITRWLLNFSMSRSVATHAMHIEEPQLDDPRLVRMGAGHYETGCRSCHGRPDRPHPRIAQHMTPRPPFLPPVISEWEPKELFYIVKHGVKFTGMPAWPAPQRDDEVWAVVAFLLELPQMNADDYSRQVFGELAVEGRMASSSDTVLPLATHKCARCHGLDGLGDGIFPKLAGQSADYLAASLQAYGRDDRHSGMMEPIAAELSAQEIREVARFYHRLPSSTSEDLAKVQQAAEQHASIERGKTIAESGVPAQNVPSCVDCHVTRGAQLNPQYPSLIGQPTAYLMSQLELFKQRKRGGSAHSHLMFPTADGLTSAQMRDVARFYTSLAAERQPQSN